MTDIKISPLMQELRNRFGAEGIKWTDASEEFELDNGYVYHMERTKVHKNNVEIVSCIYGYSGTKGNETGSTYGWPDLIESWDSSNSEIDPEPRTIEEIIATVKEDWNR